jgi:hypothetical protein
MIKQLLLTWTCAVVVSLAPALASSPKIKFGQVSMEEMKMTAYDKDPEAEAVVLYDYGSSYISYVGNDFKLNFKRHKRIKILKKAGYDYASDLVTIYQSGSEREKVTELKGFTYNLENGKVVKTKLNSESIFDEKISDHLDAKKFTLPNVKEGSVIEFTYTVSSDFLSNLRDWEFQSEIPTVWSEYNVKYYEYFDFKQMFQGYEPIESDYNMSTENIIIQRNGGHSGAGMRATYVSASQETVNARTHNYVWIAKEVSALKEEPFVTTMDDYVTKVFFDLAAVKFPGALTNNYSQTWESINKLLLESSDFGSQLNKGGFLKNELAAITAADDEPVRKMVAILSFVKANMKWNQQSRMFCSTNLRKVWEAKSGSSADINLLLLALLREAGLFADPVILSTRSHGRIMQSFAHLSRFNYVVASVTIDGKYYLLDATDPYSLPNMLPVRCLNGEGRAISSTNPRWIPLASPEKQVEMLSAQLNISPEGLFSGKVQSSSGGYAAMSKRKDIMLEGKEKYATNLKNKTHNWDIDKLEIKDLEQLGKTLAINYEVNSQEPAAVGDMIYLNPMLLERETENPFKHDSRKFPIDFAVAKEAVYICNFTVPADYQVEELPKSAIVSLPDDGGRFTYALTHFGNTIQITSRLQLKKALFMAEEYPALKEFFGHVVAKHAEQIVLKKVQ